MTRGERIALIALWRVWIRKADPLQRRMARLRSRKRPPTAEEVDMAKIDWWEGLVYEHCARELMNLLIRRFGVDIKEFRPRKRVKTMKGGRRVTAKRKAEAKIRRRTDRKK